MRTHPLNVSYLVVGLAFLGVSLSWALSATDVIATDDLGWLLPLSLVVAGTIGLIAFAARGRSRRTPAAAGGVEGGYDSGYDSRLDLDTQVDLDTELDTRLDSRLDSRLDTRTDDEGDRR